MTNVRLMSTIAVVLILSESVTSFWMPWPPGNHGNHGNHGACRHQGQGYPSDRQGLSPRPLGCFRSNDLSTVSRETRNGRMTHELCFAFCQGGMYTYGGMRNRDRCLCYAEFNQTGNMQQPDSNCDLVCPGDPNENQICGGENFITLYSLF